MHRSELKKGGYMRKPINRDYCLLQCDVLYSGRNLPTCQRNLLCPSLGQKNSLPDGAAQHPRRW